MLAKCCLFLHNLQSSEVLQLVCRSSNLCEDMHSYDGSKLLLHFSKVKLAENSSGVFFNVFL
jgi:hypothetical protein